MPTKAQRVGEDIISTCWSSNSDGAGFMHPDLERKTLIVNKGFMTLHELQAAFKLIPEGVPVALHFRIKTHGPRNADNTHPHVVIPNETAIVHNGVLAIGASADSPESDTARFARMVLAAMPKLWFKNPALVHLIEEYMGKCNKMVAMDARGAVKILNEDLGVWDQGVWFSNQSFRPRKTYVQTYNYSDHDAYDYLGGHYGTTVTPGVEAGSQVAAAGSAGTSVVRTDTEPASAGGASTAVEEQKARSNEETQVINVIPNQDDPLVELMLSQILTQEELTLMAKDIGSMTEAEWKQYETITDHLKGML